MKTTVKELLSLLKDMPGNLVVQIDCDSGIWEDIEVEQVGENAVIFGKGDPLM